MKHIFIVGSRGYHVNYGGWETFTDNLVDKYNDKNTIFHVGMITDDINMKSTKISSNLFVDYIYIKNKGSIKMFLYAIKSFNFYLKYIENNNIDNAYIYVLGLKLFNYLAIKKRIINKLNIKVFVNPDGLEWMRSKWSYPVKKFFLLSERFMLNNCDKIICDALGIQEYVCRKYPKLSSKTEVIAYGYNDVDVKGIDEQEVLNAYNLKKDDYLLMVGRCVPENNYEMVINGYMKSTTSKKLVIISNLSSSNYYNDLLQKTGCESNSNIIFIDGVYDKQKLSIIRKNAYSYIHGHSVGGTNPSLIEALALTDINILYDVCFNRDVGADACLYFDDEKSLTKILNDSKTLNKNRSIMSKTAKQIVQNNYTWKIIIDKYKKIFK
ncbi:MAG: DUF1972 domain-containing protein [Bacilli bacterium]|nr:DUF1972 domain-containing protein [Bacilli bacterium]